MPAQLKAPGSGPRSPRAGEVGASYMVLDSGRRLRRCFGGDENEEQPEQSPTSLHALSLTKVEGTSSTDRALPGDKGSKKEKDSP